MTSFWYTTEKALEMKSTLEAHPEGMTAKQLAEASGTPLVSARRYANLLVEMFLAFSTTPVCGVATVYYPRFR